MKRTKNRVTGSLTIALCCIVLLLPSLMVTGVWTDLNFFVSLAMILVSIVVALSWPKLRWLAGALASLVIAIPPYPYWMVANENGWKFSFFYGFRLEHVPFATFILVFLISLAALAAVFRALAAMRG